MLTAFKYTWALCALFGGGAMLIGFGALVGFLAVVGLDILLEVIARIHLAWQ